MKIFLTGGSGFVGKNVSSYFSNNYSINRYIKNSQVRIQDDIVIHLAGLAHDLKNVSNIDKYYIVNTELTKQIFDAFLVSEAQTFITLSSVKAAADEIEGELKEDQSPNPITHYGKSKLYAEQYIYSKEIPMGKRVYVLRPCMIYGPGNKGNLNLLNKFVSKNIPWPLGAFQNRRSFCSIDNLMFVFKELIERTDIPSGIYNIADDDSLSTNDLIGLIAISQNKYPKVLKIPTEFIRLIGYLGDKFHLPFNTDLLQKLTSSYIVSNAKLKAAIGKPLPVSTKEGLLTTFKLFNSKVK
jgi:nucleoside-diphosphate-sugar epimerase